MNCFPHNSAAAAAVLDQLACGGCKYRLRGLDPAGVCPECGMPILDTSDREIRREQERRMRRLGRRPDPPAHPPLAGAPRGWVYAVAAGAALLTAAHAGAAAWAGHYVRRWGLGVDLPERLFLAAGAAYLAGAWLLTWPERQPSKPSRRRRPVVHWTVVHWTVVRWAVRLLAAAAPASAWLMWRSWDVPWWDADAVAARAGRWALLTVPCQWLAFDYLAFLISGGGRLGLARLYRAARWMAAASALLFAGFWPPTYRADVSRVWQDLNGGRVPLGLIVFVLPPVLLAAFGPLLVVAARPRTDKTGGAADAGHAGGV